MAFNKEFTNEVFNRLSSRNLPKGSVIRVLDYGAGNAWVMTILSEFLDNLGYALDYIAVDTSKSVVVKLWERGIVTKTYEEVVTEDDNSYDFVLLGDMEGLISLDELGTLLKLVKDKSGLLIWKYNQDFENLSDKLVFLS